MAKSKAEKLMAKEKKREEKQRRIRVEEANKMLLPVSKQTTKSLGLLSFDPSGAMRFENDRWLKIYDISYLDLSSNTLPRILGSLHGKIRITSSSDEKREKRFYLTICYSAETYDEVLGFIKADELVLSQVLNLKALTIDETMNAVMKLFGKDEAFSYVSEVRRKNDWQNTLFSEVKDEGSYFRINGTIGQCSFILQYPSVLFEDVYKNLQDLSCEVLVTYDLAEVSEEEQADYKRHLEKRFCRRITREEQISYCNLSCMMIFFADSFDAKEIIEKMLHQYFSRDGFIISSCSGFEKEAVESVLSLGMKDFSIMRNVSFEVAEKMLGMGETGSGSN